MKQICRGLPEALNLAVRLVTELKFRHCPETGRSWRITGLKDTHTLSGICSHMSELLGEAYTPGITEDPVLDGALNLSSALDMELVFHGYLSSSICWTVSGSSKVYSLGEVISLMEEMKSAM